MSTNEQNGAAEEPKKLSQAERVKQLLAQKKQAQGGLPGQKHHSTGTQELKSQNTKKVNNQRKKMGV
ncbi:hypothetical protein [Paenibacillus harenae]|uniref:Uncharacterized protein n=1 Tax=Paenibacillus harenae TaxID=306543 RepID=A0ABT9U9R2_PAEHA|nr:hypothetical protein [Paenibacillus harenae]MDQ0063493.1 hypothetical protein [Paenibacillus harenae]MDQ0115748.1 hypothetical protein [Paenibacillus harenae]